MRDQDKLILFLVLFVVIPFLQWLARQIQAAKERAREERKAGSKTRTAWTQDSRTEAESTDTRQTDDDDPLPEWFPDGVWEVIEDPEPVEEEIRGTREITVEAANPPPPPPPPSRQDRPSLVPSLPAARGETGSRGDRSSAGASRRPPPPRGSATARPPRPSAGESSDRRGFAAALARRTQLQQAVLWSEILGKPRGLRPHSTDDR